MSISNIIETKLFRLIAFCIDNAKLFCLNSTNNQFSPTESRNIKTHALDLQCRSRESFSGTTGVEKALWLTSVPNRWEK